MFHVEHRNMLCLGRGGTQMFHVKHIYGGGRFQKPQNVENKVTIHDWQ